jgi:hypothetical protein
VKISNCAIFCTFKGLQTKRKKMFLAQTVASDSERVFFACVGLSEQRKAMFS